MDNMVDDDTEYDLSSTDLSEEENAASSDDEYDPGGYTKLVIGKWEKQGHTPTPINRASLVGSPAVVSDEPIQNQKPKQCGSKNKENTYNVKDEVKEEQTSANGSSIRDSKVTDSCATTRNEVNLNSGVIANLGSGRNNKAFKTKLTLRHIKPSRDGDQDISGTTNINKKFRIIDGKKWRECAKCAKLFRTIRELKEHNKTHRNDPISEPDLRIIDGKRWRECSICQKRFHTRKELSRHIRVHTNERPYECFVCGKAFKDLAHMNSHLRIHSGEKPYTCEICGTNFSEKSSMKRHIRRHLGIKPFKCTMCPKRYEVSSRLKEHMRSHLIDKGEMSKLRCALCSKEYKREETLKVHMKMHDPERQIKCPDCGRLFLTLRHLKEHSKAIHQEKIEQTFVCGICEKTFTTNNRLQKHMKQHTLEDKQYKCDQCIAFFTEKSQLQEHKAIAHGGDDSPNNDDDAKASSHKPVHHKKSYECDVCHCVFNCASKLKRHKLSHDSGWKYCCHMCPKVFKFKESLCRHLVKVLEHKVSREEIRMETPKSHKCSLCGYTFPLKEILKAHLKVYHGLIDNDVIDSHLQSAQTSVKEELQDENIVDKKETNIVKEEKLHLNSTDCTCTPGTLTEGQEDVPSMTERAEDTTDHGNPSTASVPYLSESLCSESNSAIQNSSFRVGQYYKLSDSDDQFVVTENLSESDNSSDTEQCDGSGIN